MESLKCAPQSVLDGLIWQSDLQSCSELLMLHRFTSSPAEGGVLHLQCQSCEQAQLCEASTRALRTATMICRSGATQR